MMYWNQPRNPINAGGGYLNQNIWCIEIIELNKYDKRSLTWTKTYDVLKSKEEINEYVETGLEPKHMMYWNIV